MQMQKWQFVAICTVDCINKLFNSDFDTGFVYFYNFENPYVYFAENYAEWYSLVGLYGKGQLGKKNFPVKEYGTLITESKVFYNQKIFTYIVDIIGSADKVVSIIDDYNVNTFNSFYTALVTEYPDLKSDINNAFIPHQKYYFINFKVTE